jgi:hypothetical protein
VRNLLKSAFTSWPHCVATYVCLIGATWLLAFGWKPVRVDPKIYVTRYPEAEARQLAEQIGGKVWVVGFTGSMKPLLKGGEYVVSVPNFQSIKQGEVLIYNQPYHDKPIVHRAVQVDNDGWIMSGDSAKHTESWARVTASNYLGTAVAIYRPVMP